MSLEEIYADAVTRVATLAATVTPAQAGRVVPATPEWTVHDLLAHLAGAVHDFVTGETDGAPSRAWTNRHVVDRRRTPTADLGAELREYAGLLPASVVGAPGAPPRWDLLVHEQDLREALDLERAPEDTWRTLLPEVVERLGRRPAAIGFDVTTTESTWTIGVPTTALTFAAEDYELLRVLFSRRTTFEIAALTDGVGALEAVAVFGPRPG
ncbi:maleylpyruvate isomerase family mycothiol-dependent enzyme [Miniimonas arenae]|uniref:Maleylpyruvate isomerase family mycothiol-dependent enzyme n=1 Tax=Miniimonas arenae TaxID=676201 RepID=A0A5C5B7I9_9MICO|nr:maleylpyruvate isomerase family mycothiol-dependent enzyme [Miniimonas arenae]TNU72888.1 maleylpyruvate isomerase family mycothiol-dependent enzyme [Miniimonas arenae]